MQRVLRVRYEQTGLCDPAQMDAQVRSVAASLADSSECTASLAAHPVPFPNNSGRVLTEGTFTKTSLFAIQYAFADLQPGDHMGYVTAVERAVNGDYGPLLALTEAFTGVPPPNPIGDSFALEVPVGV